MGDRMTPIPFGNLMNWVLTEQKNRKTVFGVRKTYQADPGHYLHIFGEKIETPFGPAAGPNTQLAQNIIAAYLSGSRFFELKTVQILERNSRNCNVLCVSKDNGHGTQHIFTIHNHLAGTDNLNILRTIISSHSLHRSILRRWDKDKQRFRIANVLCRCTGFFKSNSIFQIQCYV